jgi:hypothetical protein
MTSSSPTSKNMFFPMYLPTKKVQKLGMRDEPGITMATRPSLAGRAEVTVVAWTANVDSVESGAGGAPTSRYSRQQNALLPSSATSSSAYVTRHASSLPDRYSDKQPQKVREKPMKSRPYQWQQGRNEAAVLAQELQIPRKHDYIPRGMHQSMVNSGSITANHKLFSRKPSISITYIF